MVQQFWCFVLKNGWKLKRPQDFIFSVRSFASFSVRQLIWVSLLRKLVFVATAEFWRHAQVWPWCEMNRVSFPLWSRKKEACTLIWGDATKVLPTHTLKFNSFCVKSYCLPVITPKDLESVSLVLKAFKSAHFKGRIRSFFLNPKWTPTRLYGALQISTRVGSFWMCVWEKDR